MTEDQKRIDGLLLTALNQLKEGNYAYAKQWLALAIGQLKRSKEWP
jgi:hypothetical protein